MPVVIDERATEKNQELIKYAYDNLKNIPKGHDEYEKMISGLPYDCLDDVLCKGRVIAHEQATDYGAIRLRDFNSFESFTQARFDYLTTIFGKVGDQSYFEPPFFVDYGYNTSFGKRCYVNFNFTVLDCSLVKIGDDCLIAPNVTITTATHPTDPSVRRGCHVSHFPIDKILW
ncbi:hypothetical protein BABINDRAFT_92368 [Babjeviella inositovora NRRL Y-12698]|uniref:Maltose/galactoside acetyltransferase domain-containing protein n=1 Tax=Babjeviella inositovora NRRL Y-12698 TaxID=984486 RepID=A0A1E3QK51_9ASCO|nr:uncharacterized protein BABINDRAFT_92368 [Babjeviella inositovora NRRL Y-12698]ODQ78076.1 hypothetical protein BABINDRAFT_92368 [Babjeviella inositovora NRRL Y-12698]